MYRRATRQAFRRSICRCASSNRPTSTSILVLHAQQQKQRGLPNLSPLVPHHQQQQRASNSMSSSTVQRIGTEDPRMSKLVIHNGVVYMSGQTSTASDGIEGQTREVLQKIDDLLKQAGTSKSNLLTAQIWLADIERDFQGMNRVWNAWLDPGNKPVRATVQSPMARPTILVEVQVTAATAGEVE